MRRIGKAGLFVIRKLLRIPLHILDYRKNWLDNNQRGVK